LPPEKDKIKDNLGEFLPCTRTSSQKPSEYDPIMPDINTEGITLFYTKTTYAPNGSIVHIKQKYP
jgi:hypothetical protein